MKGPVCIACRQTLEPEHELMVGHARKCRVAALEAWQIASKIIEEEAE